MSGSSAEGLTAEHLLIARLHVERLISTQRFSDAADVGARVLANASAACAAAPRGMQFASERVRLACSLCALGMLSGLTLKSFAELLQNAPVDEAAQTAAVAAMKALSDDDLFVWLQALEAAAPNGSRNALSLLDAAIGHLDEGVAPAVLSSALASGAARTALGAADEAVRARGLQLCAKMLRAAPVVLCDRLVPLLMTAALVEAPGLQELALATLGDVACALARVPSAHERSDALVGALEPIVRLLSVCLFAPRLPLQQIATLALGKLVLHGTRRHRPRARDTSTGVGSHRVRSPPAGSDVSSVSSEDDAAEAEDEDGGAHAATLEPSGSCLEACTDLERLVADLAFRYTAPERAPAPPTAPAMAPHATLGGKAKGAAAKAKGAAAAEKAHAAGNATLMATLLAFFEALRERPVAVSNAIVWICLGCAEEGCLGGGNGGGDGEEEPDERTSRCLRFLASHLPEAAVASVVQATVLNLQHQHGLDVDAARVAGWLH